MFSMKLEETNTGVSTSVQKICPLSNVSLKKRFFTGKKYYGITIILVMYQSAMLHKYKQNITFNVINTQIHVVHRTQCCPTNYYFMFNSKNSLV